MSDSGDVADIRTAVENAQTYLGIELGSTRIKAVLIGPDHSPIASGGYGWQNQFVDRVWTYRLDDVWQGLRTCYAELAADVNAKYGVPLTTLGGLGISAMMHGYLAFDASDELLTPFRTWRNTSTGPAAAKLSDLFGYNIPLRWSIAHLYQALLNGEDHVPSVAYLTTLSGYVHWQLTGQRVLGVGDASGMFPIDIATGDFNAGMLDQFDAVVGAQVPWRVRNLLPKVLSAGAPAGVLTEAGAALLDPSGMLRPGVRLCPPEGDAGTGMVATNTVAPRTGNVSAGTSIFAMVVLEHELASRHEEIDLVTTPSGDLVGMVHCNNCASDLDAWVGVLGEAARALGADADPDQLYSVLFNASLGGDCDAGGLLGYNYLSGESITGFEEGRPLIVRSPDARLTLANLMRTLLFSSLATLRIGMDVLFGEGVQLDDMFAHGGLFRTPGIAQRYLAAALGSKVSVGAVAGEGGAWGMALLAAYGANKNADQTLAKFLDERVFAGVQVSTLGPDPVEVAGFDAFMQRYVQGLPIEAAAVTKM